VIADSAALVNGLSTALSVVGSEMTRAVLGGKDRAYFVPFSEKDAFWL
jgi:hypothetical protein